MAKCPACNLDMLDERVTTCVANKVIEYPDGKRLRSKTYQNGQGHRCSDCNVLTDGKHHPGCDKEPCPRCHGQLISCGCFDKGE